MNNPANTKEKHLPSESIVQSCAILIISTSLFQLKSQGKPWKERDRSGQIAVDVLKKKFPKIKLKTILLPDNLNNIRSVISELIQKRINLIVTLGGTGVDPNDLTIEAINPLLDKELPGFGELFRLKTYNQVGTLSIMTRATTGIAKKTCITALPGSPNATKLGFDILLPELDHILALLYKTSF